MSSTINGTVRPLLIEHLNPFAFFYHVLSTSRGFTKLLVESRSQCRDGRFTAVLYMDKAVPGQANRHDHGRSCQGIYFAILELPYWFLSRRNGWMPFSYVPYKDQLAAGVSDTMLLRFFARTFHGNDRPGNFEEGLAILTALGMIHLRLKVALTTSDWEELIHMYHLTGYNGSLPCGVCKNVMGRCAPFSGHPYLVHVSSTSMTETLTE